MYSALTTFLHRLDSQDLSDTAVIEWGAPVPSFGDLDNASVATLGLNPSNREFVDESGNELSGQARRFHTLSSLHINSWAEASTRHLHMIVESCRSYFGKNPYDRWFGKLDEVVTGAKASFYGENPWRACHLDLIPYATERKWTGLTTSEQNFLLERTSDALGLLLRESEIKVLILNGRSVVDNFQRISGVALDQKQMPSWSLPRRKGSDVPGVAFWGSVQSLKDVPIGNSLLVLGYNHNIQSSFGVTKEVVKNIRSWVSEKISNTDL